MEELENTSISQLIYQYLKEHHYDKTLKQLQEESGEEFEPEKIKIGGQLETIIDEYRIISRVQGLEEKEDLKIKARLNEKGEGNFANKLKNQFHSVHTGNILCAHFSHDPHSNLLASGSSDRTVQLLNWKTGEMIHTVSEFTSAILSVQFNPKHKNLLAASCMDGSVCIVDVDAKKVVQQFIAHKKYVVCVRWSKDGKYLASGSYDHCLNLYIENEGGKYQLLKSFQYPSNVESIVFSETRHAVITTIREDNYFHEIDLDTFKETKWNMNANMDDHVSFSVLNLSFSDDEEFLLVSTDRDRLIMYRYGSSNPVRNFYGANNDMYSQPRNCWHKHSNKYVYSTSQNHKVYCWEVATQSVVTCLEGHKGLIRDVVHHPTENVVASVSYDRSIFIWEHDPNEEK